MKFRFFGDFSREREVVGKERKEDVVVLLAGERRGLTKGALGIVVSHMLTGDTYNYHCHSNLTRALLLHGVPEPLVHDVLNVFQVTGLDSQGRYFMEASPATPSSYMTFFAEQPLLCALSTCPGGDLSAWGWHQAEDTVGRDEGLGKGDMKSTCRPIRVEVFEVNEKIRERIMEGWEGVDVGGYKGTHGMTVPGGEE